MQSASVISYSPSFNSYSSSDKLTQIAARVVHEFQSESDFDDDYLFDEISTTHNHVNEEEGEEEEEEEEEEESVKNDKNDDEENDEKEFEFPFLCREPDLSPNPADEIFYNGQIRPVYPLFNTDLLFSHEEVGVDNSISSMTPKTSSSSARLPLGKLFMEERERDTASSCSSSESDELDGVPSETYCVWTPKSAEAEESPGRCKKSSSTGTSKRWKLRNILRRSNSDGKDTFASFLDPREGKIEKGMNDAVKVNGNVIKSKEARRGNDGETTTVPTKGTVKESDRRRLYLPYKKDLVGLFANVNGVSRNLHPF